MQILHTEDFVSWKQIFVTRYVNLITKFYLYHILYYVGGFPTLIKIMNKA